MHPILLIHGFPFDASMWQLQADHLRAKGHTVITPNLPGFGDAPPLPRDKSSIDAFASHIHDIIFSQANGKAIVAGFSMGGYVLLALLRDYPESLAAAMLIDSRPDADSPDTRAARLSSIDEIKSNGPAKVIDANLAKVLRKKPDPATQSRVRAIMEKQSPDAMINALWAMSKRRDQTDLLPELTLPVLVVVGAEDVITPPSVALNMQSHMPHAMVVQIVGAGHMTPMEQPDPLNAAIETFLTTVK